MDPRQLVRWSGLATILFGTLLAAGTLLDLILEPARGSTVHLTAGTMQVAAFLLGVFAVTGIYTRHARGTGALVLVGYVAAVVGLVLTLATAAFFTFLDPWVVEQAPHIPEGFRDGSLAAPAAHVAMVWVADLALLGGLVLLIGGVAREAMLPRGAVLLALVGGVLAIIGGYALPVLGAAGNVVFGAAAAWIGYALWAEPADDGHEPAVAPA